MDPVGVQFAPIISENPYELHGHLTNGFNFSQTSMWSNRDDRNFMPPTQNGESLARSTSGIDGNRNVTNKIDCNGKGNTSYL